MPYQPVIDLVTQALELAPTAALHEAAARVARGDRGARAGASRSASTVPVLSADFPEARQARLFRAIVQLLEALAAGRQLVVIVDDLQWADDASAQFLHYLARQAASLPVLVAVRVSRRGARQPRALGGSRRELAARAARAAHAARAAAARRHEAAARGSRRARSSPRACIARPTAIAFFLTSMLHALREGEISDDAAGELPLPDALRASVRARLAHVPAEARPTLDVAAVLGRRFDFESLFAVTKSRRTSCCARSRRSCGGACCARSPTGDATTSATTRCARWRTSRSAARAAGCCTEPWPRRSSSSGEGEPHERDARLAEHYERGHVWSKAVHYMVLAAQRSQKLFAMREALDWFDRAIELAAAHRGALDGARAHRRARAARRARAQAGQTEGAVADIRLVIDAARARGDRAKARDALIQLGMTYRRGDDYARPSQCLDQALDECRALGDERQAADTLYHLGTVMWSDGRNREAIAYHAEAVEICERLGLSDLVAVQAYHGRGEAHFLNLEHAAAIRCFQRSIELARSIGDKSYESENLMMVGVLVLRLHGIRRLRAGARRTSRPRSRSRSAQICSGTSRPRGSGSPACARASANTAARCAT